MTREEAVRLIESAPGPADLSGRTRLAAIGGWPG
jgi:hypothetical protein